MPLGASIDRMEWLPNTMPASPIGQDLWILAAIAPMLIWDVVRNRRVHEAYWLWLSIYAPVVLLVAMLWDKPWWHAMAQRIMGV
jgi:hypothetical protein